MSLEMENAQQTFVEESRDLLTQMEEALLRLESEPGDAETLAAMFRAAHTIKGSAGLFGFDAIVSFTHVAESVLDRVREGKLDLNAETVALLLAHCDHISRQLDSVVQGKQGVTAAEDETKARQILAGLSALLGDSGHAAAGPQPAAAQAQHPSGNERSDGDSGHEHWHLSLRFGPDALRNGMDPASFLRYLGTLGDIHGLVTLIDAMPAPAAMDAESCYLGFEIEFESDAKRAAILGVFEFVRDDCKIVLLPPRSRTADYLKLIEQLPEDNLRLGEILIACGALTRAELDEGLRQQEDEHTAVASADAGASGDAAETAKRPIGSILVDRGAVGQPVVAAAVAKQERGTAKRQEESRFVRVPADKLDQLINLVGELVIASAGANLHAGRNGDAVLQESTQQVIGLVEEIRDGALALRMVEIGETFNRFRRVVRDVSQELGKDIELIISGGDAELDKSVVERIADPLTHLIRNAMDHGIESAAARAAAGKPARGTVRLNACHDSGSIVIEVSDDGQGLNRDRILQKAIERGIVSPTQNLSDAEILNLVFLPGFSTAEKVSNLSGRGVGMDVVKRNIDALRGTVNIESQQGQGSKIIIRLPLTLAIIDGFLVGVGSASYVVPLDMMVECIDLGTSAGSNHYLNLRGQVLPFLRLREAFDLEGSAGARESVVVVQFAGQKAGLVVDALKGEFQTVIKPLGKLFQNLRGIGGSTILGSGEVALILDVPGLVQLATSADHTRLHAEAHQAAPAAAAAIAVAGNATTH